MLKRHLTHIVLGLALGVTAALPSAAGAAPKLDGTFPLTEPPRRLTQGPDGNIWVALGTKVAKVTPAGVVTEFDPADITSSNGIAAGPDGKLWVTQSGGVASFTPADPLSAVKTAINSITDPRQLVTGPDGNLWTASGDQVVKIPPAAPATATATTVAGMSARDIASGGDGNLWVADFTGNVVSVTTAGVATSIPTGGGLQGIAAGPAKQIVFADPGSTPQRLGRLTPGGPVQSSPAPGTDPFGITFASDGAYWFAEFAKDSVGRMTPGGAVTALPGLPAGSGPRYVTNGPGNTLWVGLEQGKMIARVTGLEPPAADTTAPRVTALTAGALRRSAGRRSAFARFTLSERAKVSVTLLRVRPGRPALRVATLVRTRAKGRAAVFFAPRRLTAGRYRVTVVARDAAGNASGSVARTFQVAR